MWLSSETWMVHFPSGLAIRSQWTLYFIQSFVQIRGLVWHSQRGSLKVCVTCSRWTIWHLEEMPARRKVGTSCVFQARVLWNFGGFLVCIHQWMYGEVQHIFQPIFNLSGILFSGLTMSEWEAHLKCCYLTWQEQDCWQSPETTLCQRNTNRL